jgi:hypothetical protein
VQKVEYGRVFSDISNGYSRVTIDNNDYFFKHPNQVENFSIYDRYSIIYEFAKSRGVQTEEEKIQTAIEGGWWSRDKESSVSSLKNLIATLKQTKEKLAYPSQKDEIDKQILRNERILISYLKDRQDVIGYTAEQYAGERFQDETIIKLTYKNIELTERLFSSENDYYYLSDDIVDKIRRGFQGHSNLLTLSNVKCTAACGFFQNLLFVTECNPVYLWGRAAVDCTKYQLDMLIYGKIIKNLIKYRAESDSPLSDEVLSDPKKLVEVSEARDGEVQHNQPQSSSNSSSESKVTSFVGATSEDLKKMGVKIEKIGGKSLLDIVKEKGGKLDKADYLSARLRM